ncbi:MAG: penicillin-binding protein 1A [bacterium]
MESRYRKNILFWFIVLAFIVGGVLAGVFLSVLHGLPEIRTLEDFRPFMATKVFSRDDRLITQWFIERRSPVPLHRIPPLLKQATIAVEDQHFFEHEGLDWLGILRAAIVNLKAGRILQGGSTITQQLSKVLFLTPEKSFDRKAKEALLAIQIERMYKKEEILDLYLNQIYYGNGAYGVQAAAQTFFGKDVWDLTLTECALIAGIPKAPTLYSPLSFPDRSLMRRSHVLERMRNEGYITQQEFTEAINAPIGVVNAAESLPSAPYFVEKIRQDLERELGPNLLYRGGLQVYTTLDLDAQEAAERAVAAELAQLEKRRAHSGLTTREDLPVQAALIAIDPHNGHVICQVGGRDFSESKFNRAVQAKRQPGSAFKPIIYTAAIQSGFTPADIIMDAPVIYKIPGRQKPWKPQNFRQKFYGPIRLRTALEKSVNVATVKLMNKIGVTNAIHYARMLGIESPLKPYLSLALGAFEVSLEEITAAYVPFANNGFRVQPIYIRSVTDHNGQNIYSSMPLKRQVISPSTAYIMASLLQGVVERGTGRRAKEVGVPVGGKTGTTDNYTDAWFIGFSPYLVTGVWVGFDQKITLGRNETGSRAACPIWTTFMQSYHQGRPRRDFEKPNDVVEVPIDPENGLRVTGSFPNRFMEVFQRGTEPREYSRSELRDGIGSEDYYLRFIE